MNSHTTLKGLMNLGDNTSSEEVAKIVPGARLAKAFNTMISKPREIFAKRLTEQEFMEILIREEKV